MSFLGLEEPVQYTGYQIFDPTMAKMILDALDKYFNAVYADYQQGLEDMKEFKKEYYDFDTPILADLDWYNRNVTGKVRNFINDAYARGIDLTRTPEGRAAIALMINSVDVGKVAKLRSSKLAAEDYIKARGVLQSKGLYSPEMEAFVTGGRSLENWNTLGGDGIWNRTSPIEAASLLDLTYDYYKNRTPRDLTAADFIESNGLNASMFDPKYKYSGYLYSDLLNNAQGAALGIANDPRAAYFRELAKQKVIARGEDPTQDAINSLFYRDIADTNKWALVNPTKEADEFALDDHRTANDDWLDAQKQNRENYYKEKYAKDHPTTAGGYSLAKDLYTTSLAQAAGRGYPSTDGITPEELEEMLKTAKQRQKYKIKLTGHVLSATGMFISPTKIRGIIPSTGENGNGEFLDYNYLDKLHDPDDVRSSYAGWRLPGVTDLKSKEWREQFKEKSNKIVAAIPKWHEENGNDYKLKVVPEKDENGYNIYGIVGDDGRWHTYARVKVYMSDGKKNTMPVVDRENKDKKFIEKNGTTMLLEVGLKSNEGTASPDLSISAREELGPYAFEKTKKWIGLTGNADWPWGTN